jgi:hypothetical protein
MTQDMNHQPSLNITETPQHAVIPKLKKKRLKQTGLSWIDDPHSAVKGETGLWIAVITQALVDALCKSKNPELLYCKDEAIRWLTNNNKDFVEVCLLAGFDPSYVRRKAKKAIAAPSAWRAAPGLGKRYMERKVYTGRRQKKIGLQEFRRRLERRHLPFQMMVPKLLSVPGRAQCGSNYDSR